MFGEREQRQQRLARRRARIEPRRRVRVQRRRRAPRARGRTAGTSSTSASTGMSPTSSSPSNTRRCSVSVTAPITVARTSQRSQTSSTSSSRAGSTTHSIRSCDSEIMISNGSMSASRSGTRDTSMSSPTSPFDAISDELRRQPGRAEVLQRRQQVALQQLETALHQLRLLERVADLHGRALRRRPRPTARRSPAPTPRRSRRGRCARRAAPAALPTPAAALRISRSRGASPTHIALTRQFCS